MLMPQELDPVLEEPYPELTKNIATDLLPLTQCGPPT